MSKKVAMILSGCGVYDGSEIHETVLTMLRLSQQGAQARKNPQLAKDVCLLARKNSRVDIVVLGKTKGNL